MVELNVSEGNDGRRNSGLVVWRVDPYNEWLLLLLRVVSYEQVEVRVQAHLVVVFIISLRRKSHLSAHFITLLL